jgi:putative transposase
MRKKGKDKSAPTSVTLVERHAFTPEHVDYFALDHLCFLAKNLYNSTLYAVRQHFFATDKYMNYFEVNRIFTHSNQTDYIAFPRRISKCVQMLVDRSFKSFFALVEKKRKGKLPEDYKVNIPRYLDKINGRQVVEYTKQALSFVEQGYVKLSGTEIRIPTNQENIRFARIVPKANDVIMVEIGYMKPIVNLTDGDFAALDLGVNNLCAITSCSFAPFIINGRPLKSINQYYNKKLARLKSRQDLHGGGRKTTKRIKALTRKRNSKIEDYLHKASRVIVNHLVSNNIKTLVIGLNKGWKQDINLGKRNNQNFVSLPFSRFIKMLSYKCALVGIIVVTRNESYTSKCSFLDNEDIKKHTKYSGTRSRRGLFKASDGRMINADVNASLNILKLHLLEEEAWNEEVYSNLVEVCSTPSVFTVKNKQKRKTQINKCYI